MTTDEGDVKVPGYASVEAILMTADLAEEDMTIPEWGGAVLKIRGLSKREQQDIRRQATRNGKVDDTIAEMLMFIQAVVEPKFETKHYAQLCEKASGVVDRINWKITELSGAAPQQQEEVAAQFPGPGE